MNTNASSTMSKRRYGSKLLTALIDRASSMPNALSQLGSRHFLNKAWMPVHSMFEVSSGQESLPTPFYRHDVVSC